MPRTTIKEILNRRKLKKKKKMKCNNDPFTLVNYDLFNVFSAFTCQLFVYAHGIDISWYIKETFDVIASTMTKKNE